MSRFLGGIFGQAVGFTTNVPYAESGVYTTKEISWMRQRDGWIPAMDASGGNTTDTSTFAGRTVHIFTSPGNLVVNRAGPGEVGLLVIGGGGGGGAAYGGGGGAGAYINVTKTLTTGTYPITVGAGGAFGGPGGGTPYKPPSPGAYQPGYAIGLVGADSVFGGPTQPQQTTSPGGGGGGARATAGGPGGSGGGGGDGYPTGGNPGGPTNSPTGGNTGGAGSGPFPGSDPTWTYGGGGGSGRPQSRVGRRLQGYLREPLQGCTARVHRRDYLA